MEAIMEAIFVGAGHLVEALGPAFSILLVGLSPIYIYVFFLLANGREFLKSRKRIIAGSLALILSIILCSIFSITAVVMGAWG